MKIADEALTEKIKELLECYYKKRSAALNDLRLSKALQRKNPYLYCAAGVADASEIIEEILRAFVSSSDETLFGNEFFEPLAKWVAETANLDGTVSVTTSDGEGVDVTITTNKSVRPIAVKSGKNVFNSDSRKKQCDNFEALRKRLLKLGLLFDPIVGYCYGRKSTSTTNKSNFREFAGQAFWELITEDEDFYLRIVQQMGSRPVEHRLEFEKSFDQAKNRFVKEFLADFSTDEGAINWNKLLEFNSGKARPKTIRAKSTNAAQDVISELAETL